MRVSWRLLCLAAVPAVGLAWAQEDETVKKARASVMFERGINLTHLFIFPKAEDWPPFRGPKANVTDEELARLAALGFDFIRLPVDPTPYIGATVEQRRDLIADLTGFVRRANAAGLAVMVAGYTTDGELAWRPGREVPEGGQDFEAYAAWLEDIAVALAETALGKAAIELMNEPQSACVGEEGTDWAAYQEKLHARVRAHVDLPIVLTGGCWSQIEGLTRLAGLPDDPNTLFDVHYYEPFAFTHQGATWTSSTITYVGGLRFPPAETDRHQAEAAVETLIAARHDGGASEAVELRAEAMRMVDRYRSSGHGPHRIQAEFNELAAWAERHGIDPSRIMIGEFGAFGNESISPGASRERYLGVIRATAEAHGFGWAMWSYFGLLKDEIARTPSLATARALGLDEEAIQPKAGFNEPRRSGQ